MSYQDDGCRHGPAPYDQITLRSFRLQRTVIPDSLLAESDVLSTEYAMRILTILSALFLTPALVAQRPEKDVDWITPALPDGKLVVTDTSDAFLKPTARSSPASPSRRRAPTIDFLYYPGQTYPGKPWSNWGDSLAVERQVLRLDRRPPCRHGKGPHTGNAFVFEYDPEKKSFRQLVDVAKVLNLPDGHYTPGKIHGRLDLGDDGWLYFSTHRGSTTVTTDRFHYKGDWIIRCDPKSGKSGSGRPRTGAEALHPEQRARPEAADLLRRHSARHWRRGRRASSSSPTTCGTGSCSIDGPDGPSRYMIFAGSTGRVYYVPGKDEGMSGPLMRFDPDKGGPPVKISRGSRPSRRDAGDAAGLSLHRVERRQGDGGHALRVQHQDGSGREARRRGGRSAGVHRVDRRRPDRALPVLHPRRARRRRSGRLAGRAVRRQDARRRR